MIDFGCPVFDLLYQQDFQARLSSPPKIGPPRPTPFATVAVSSFVSAGMFWFCVAKPAGLKVTRGK